jgi:hypothetical protein
MLMKKLVMTLDRVKGWKLMKFNSALLFSIFLISTLLHSGCANAQQPNNAVSSPQSEIKGVESLGIEVVSMRQTAGGFMLDFRYRVLDPEKAMPLFLEEITPYLIDQDSGSKLPVTGSTKVGSFRPTSGDPREGITYFMFFGNPGQLVKIGTRVTVVVNEHRIENIVVQ